MSRATQKRITSPIPDYSPVIAWEVRAYRPASASVDGDDPEIRHVISAPSARTVTLSIPRILNDREGVDRFVEVSQKFTRDQFAEFLQQLTEINEWILEPFEIPTTEEKN